VRLRQSHSMILTSEDISMIPRNNDKFFRQVTSVLLTIFLAACTVALYKQYDPWLVSFFLVLLLAVWYGAGRE
jgi:hypothetical protein